jgi:hypothetical protein
MPKLYEYLGIIVYFYSNEHNPIHVHGRHAGCESRAEILVENGKVVQILIGPVAGKRQLADQSLKNFRELVEYKAEEIVERWVDFFIKNIRIPAEKISRLK